METVKQIPLEEHILEKENVEPEFEKLKQNIDTPKSIQEKLRLAKETGESQDIITKIEDGEGIIVEEVLFVKKEGLPMMLSIDIRFCDKTGCFSFRKLLPKNIYFSRPIYSNNLGLEKIIEPEFREQMEIFLKTDDHFCLSLGTLDEKSEDGFIHYGDLSKKGARMCLAHEIGHARKMEKEKKRREEEKKIRRLLWNDYEKSDKANHLVPDEDEILLKISTPFGSLDSRPVPRKHIEMVDKLIWQSERDVWAFALKIVRQQKQDGIDLEPSLKTQKDFDELIHGEGAFGSYEFIHKQIGGPLYLDEASYILTMGGS